MRVTLAQISPKLSKSNLDLHLALIEEYSNNSDIIVFPELSLNGYLLLDKVYEDAYTIDELDSLQKASLSCDIIVGLALKDRKEIYNASIYFSEGEIKHIHCKNHLPTYGMFEESRYFFKGDTIDSFETKYGTSAMVICEDLWRASSIERLANLGVETIFVLAASPARGFEDDTLEVKEQWNAICKTTALLTNAQVIFVNRVGFEDGLGFWGGSCIVSSSAKIQEELPLLEETISSFDLLQNSFQAQKYIVKHH